MKAVLITLTFCYTQLLFSTTARNIKNNACTHMIDYHFSSFSPRCYENKDVFSNVYDMVERNGYDLKNHTVVTEDGYILTLFEIKSKMKNSTNAKKFTIFVQHGIATNSGVWVSTKRRAIAFYFADLGYQVWLGNVRGTIYSNKHVNMTVNDPDYWNYNLDNMAAEDMMTQLSFVAKTSGQKIHYIGHSMGTTLVLMFASSFEQKANEILQSLTLLAPIAYLDGVTILELGKTPFLVLIKILDLLKIRGLSYQENQIHRTLISVCKRVPVTCYQLLIAFAFGKSTHFPSEDLLVYFSYWPSGTSIFQFKQYLQIVKSKKFQKFDYGRRKNLKVYGTKTPPVYNLSKIKLPVSLFYGKNDALALAKNVERLHDEIGSSKKSKYSVPSGDNGPYNHVDFMYAKSIDTDLYKPIAENLNRYENN